MSDKPMVPVKFTKLKRLMKHLTSIESLTYQECHDIYGLNKTTMRERIYGKIVEVAKI